MSNEKFKQQHQIRQAVYERDIAAERAAVKAASDAAVKPPQEVPIHIRPMEVTDSAFVIDSWCASYSRSPQIGETSDEVFKIEQRNLVYRLIPKCKILVACDPAQRNTIRGWAAAEPPREPNGLWILHYVLTQISLQDRGIARALTNVFRDASPDRMMWATHSTRANKWFGKDWLVHNHYLLYHGESPVQKNKLVGGRAYYGDSNGSV